MHLGTRRDGPGGGRDRRGGRRGADLVRHDVDPLSLPQQAQHGDDEVTSVRGVDPRRPDHRAPLPQRREHRPLPRVGQG